MITINATNLLYAARAKHKRSLVEASKRPGHRLPDRVFVPTAKVLDHRCGVLTRK